MSSRLPPPPEPFDLQCNVEVWDAEKPIIRVHHSAYGATEFNPGRGAGRFHPLDIRGIAVPTIYGSNTFAGALSETLFQRLPLTSSTKWIPREELMPLVMSSLTPKRSLRLIQLRGFGLRKLGITRVQMIESEADQFAMTRAWAAALYESIPDADGLIWMSRQHDSSEAIVLFGTRVRRADIEVAAAPRALSGEAWTEVIAAAEAAGITIGTP